MKRTEHENRCIEFFGKSFTEVHKFLDQYYKYMGEAHRTRLHNPDGVEEAVRLFGEEARCPALLHLYDDYEYFQYYTKEGKKRKTAQEFIFENGADVVEYLKKYE